MSYRRRLIIFIILACRYRKSGMTLSNLLKVSCRIYYLEALRKKSKYHGIDDIYMCCLQPTSERLVNFFCVHGAYQSRVPEVFVTHFGIQGHYAKARVIEIQTTLFVPHRPDLQRVFFSFDVRLREISPRWIAHAIRLDGLK